MSTPAQVPSPSPLASVPFRWLFGGQIVSTVGSQLSPMVIVALIVPGSDQPALTMGVVMGARFAALALFIVLGGVLADRVDRFKLLAFTDVLSIAALGPIIVMGEATPLAVVSASSFVLGASDALFAPTYDAAVTSVVGPDQLARANALTKAVRGVAKVLGPPLAGLVVVLVGGLIYWYVQDITQKKHAILRNYPLIGHLRYFFEQLGEYFRQYFFLGDREEMPFNRATRGWVYRLAKNEGGVVGFGSTYDLHHPGALIFVNAGFPVLDENQVPTPPLAIGDGYAAQPFVARSLINISGMSYGALSRPAVLALSKGAAEAGCWMDTGEGGLAPAHLEGGADIIMQIGTAKYGVRDAQGQLSDERLRELAAHPTVRAFEIKLSQGAKPGKGGVLAVDALVKTD